MGVKDYRTSRIFFALNFYASSNFYSYFYREMRRTRSIAFQWTTYGLRFLLPSFGVITHKKVDQSKRYKTLTLLKHPPPFIVILIPSIFCLFLFCVFILCLSAAPYRDVK